MVIETLQANRHRGIDPRCPALRTGTGGVPGATRRHSCQEGRPQGKGPQPSERPPLVVDGIGGAAVQDSVFRACHVSHIHVPDGVRVIWSFVGNRNEALRQLFQVAYQVSKGEVRIRQQKRGDGHQCSLILSP